ncbi:hypothetical protein [Halostella litorea]|uniref:hypothetical protein n=1 Tax=Halostella litorea TaxID=2528831 RepID=UPI001092B986|nr:hypothetical protein [Halostella litorea]
MSTPSAAESPHRSELQEIRRELRQKHDYVEDDAQLWWEISLFLEQTATHHDGSVRTLVKQTLAQLQSDPKHKLYDHRGVDNPEAAFPEACEGCPHYGIQCPVVTRKSVTDTLDRLYEQYEGDALVSELFDLANQHDCHVLQGTLDSYDQDERQYLAKGQELRRRATAHITNDDQIGQDLDADLLDDLDIDPAEFGIDPENVEDLSATPAAVANNGDTSPPPGVAERVEATTAAVRGDDEDEDDDGGRR